MFLEFLIENWPLLLALVVILALIIFEGASPTAGGRNILATDVAQITNYKQGAVLDIRDKESFATGHIANAKNLPLASLEDKISQIKKWQNKPIIVTCNTGIEARKAMKTLKQNGFDDTYLLTGGVQAWVKEGFPLVKAAKK